jgi:transcriptional regulator with XRE-family HTH domain
MLLFLAAMLTLATKLSSLRGERNYVQFAKDTRVNRQTLRDLENGASVRVSTLKKIAEACHLGADEWTNLLILWVRHELAEENGKLDIRPVLLYETIRSKPDLADCLLAVFFRLPNEDQIQLLKAIARREIRACLPALNALWERKPPPLDEPLDHDFEEILEPFASELQQGAIYHLKDKPSERTRQKPRRRGTN